ncbi:MAG: glycosyltransferase family 4 protein [Rikenellaceae bacterium]
MIVEYDIIILLILVVLELVYFKIADRFNIIDKPNERSSHTDITLRGGGIIFVIGVWVYSLFSGFEYPWFLAGLTAISGISFVDDIRGVSNKLRLVVQFISMFLMFQQLGILNLESWWIVIVALVVCVGIINAYNFMDGVNGITGGYSLAVLLPMLYLNNELQFVDSQFLVVAILSILVFGFFNFRRKAKCFAGDVGAIGIAFIVLFSISKLILATENFTYIIFLAVYGVDTVLTIMHRIKLHEELGIAHRKHAYQIMANELKIPHVAVSGIYVALQLIVSFGLIFTSLNDWVYSAIALVVLMVIYILFQIKYYPLHREFLRSRE